MGSRGVCVTAVRTAPGWFDERTANGFFDGSSYSLDGKEMSPSTLVEFYRGLIDEFPVWFLEDGCAEGDDEGWQLLIRELGDVVQLVGDDIFVADPETIRAAGLAALRVDR